MSDAIWTVIKVICVIIWLSALAMVIVELIRPHHNYDSEDQW